MLCLDAMMIEEKPCQLPKQTWYSEPKFLSWFSVMDLNMLPLETIENDREDLCPACLGCQSVNEIINLSLQSEKVVIKEGTLMICVEIN